MGKGLGLLVLLNVVVLLIGGALTAMRAKPAPLLDFNADKVRLLGRVEPLAPAAVVTPPKPPVAEAEVPEVPEAPEVLEPARCLTWPEFDQALFKDLESRMKKAGLADSDYTLTLTKPLGWWVFIPPLRDAAAVKEKVEAARQLGVKDLAPVRSGDWLHAISLGVFPTLEKARIQEKRLAGSGLKGMNVGPRPGVGAAELTIAPQVEASRVTKLVSGWGAGSKPDVCAAD